jgi:hypothetical protein
MAEAIASGFVLLVVAALIFVAAMLGHVRRGPPPRRAPSVLRQRQIEREAWESQPIRYERRPRR